MVDEVTSAERIRVFVVDDHASVRLGIQLMLETDPQIELAGTASSGHQFLEQLPGLELDVLLTDLRMADMEGVELLHRMKEIAPNVHCAVFTNYHSEEDVFNAIRAGAAAYLLKTDPMERLLEAIHTIHTGSDFIPAGVASQLAQRVQRDALTDRELEVLTFVAQGMSNEEIAAQMHVSKFTARNHLASTCRKLNAKDRAEAVAIAVRRGLLRLDS